METRDEVEKELARLEEGALYYEECHRASAVRWRRLGDLLGYGTAGSAAATTALNLPDDPQLSLVLVTSVVTTLLAAANAFYRPGEREQAHHSAFVAFNGLRGELRRARAISLPSAADDGVETLSTLARNRQAVLQSAPRYSNRTFNRTREKIMSGVFDYSIDMKLSEDRRRDAIPDQ